jgi:hypothetical protein
VPFSVSTAEPATTWEAAAEADGEAEEDEEDAGFASMAAWRDSTYPSLVIVAPDTASMSALCAVSVSAISFGTAALVCGWFGCCSIRTELILSPSKVTSTCTGPFSVSMVEPATTWFEVPPEEDVEGVEAGSATSVVDDVSVEGA